ncbi:MAG: DedA family protein [Chloroflexota bacterium]
MADKLVEIALRVMEALGYPGVALLIALENVFPPIPSELILPAAGFNVSRGSFSFPLVILASTIGSVIGALALYGIGRWLGEERLRGLVRSHGNRALLKESDIDKADAWFARYGSLAVFLCRLLPVVRSLISIRAGIDGMPLGRFVVLTAAGSALWNCALVGAGWALGTQWDSGLIQGIVGFLQWLVLVVCAGAVVWFVARRVSARRSRTA